jgi:hypothetical protein
MANAAPVPTPAAPSAAAATPILVPMHVAAVVIDPATVSPGQKGVPAASRDDQQPFTDDQIRSRESTCTGPCPRP